jgi:hypothetical protein
MDFTVLLGPLGRVIDELRGRPQFKVTVKPNVGIDGPAPTDRYLVWGGSRLKRYYLIGIQNTSTKSALVLRVTLDHTKLPRPRLLCTSREGLELLTKEPTHFLVEMDEVGDLEHSTLSVETPGWKKTYRL